MHAGGRLAASWLVVLLAATALTFESWLPGRLFVPLTPDDFPAWRAGRAEDELQRHPHPNWCMADVLHLFVPGLASTRAALERGELPLWDPSQALGVPHVHEVHYGVFYPPAWIPVLFGFPGLGVLAWLHLVLAAGGTLLYLRALGRTHSAALAGAFAFAFSAWLTARLHNPSVTGAAVWLPWLLLGLERGAARRPFGHVVAACALALSFLAGFPQVTLLVAGAALLLELVRLAVGLRQEGARALATFALALAAFVAGGLLAAPQILPTLDYLAHESARAGQDPAQIAAQALEPPLLAHLLAPDFYASTAVPGIHPLAAADLAQARDAPIAANRAETSMGVGVVALVLALATAVLGRTWRTRTWAALVLALFVLLSWPLLLRFSATVLPPLRFGNPKRLLLLSTFGLAVLAAGGVDLLRRARLRVVVLCWAFSIAATVLALVLLLAVPSTGLPEDVDAWAQRLSRELLAEPLPLEAVYELVPPRDFERAAGDARRSAVLALAAGMAAVLVFRPKSAPTERGWTTIVERVPGVLGVFIAVELLLSALPMLRSAPESAVTTSPGHIGRLRVPALASAARAVGAELPTPPRLLRIGNDPSWLRPNFPGLFGLHDAQAYAPMVPQRTAELLDALAPGSFISGSALGGVLDPGRLALPGIDLLGIDVVLTSDQDVLPPGFREVERVGAVRVLHNTEALPRAFVVHVLELEERPARRLGRLAAPHFDPRAVALVEERPAGPAGRFTAVREEGAPAALLPEGAGRPPPPGQRAATVTAYAPGSLRIEVEPGPPGLLVVSENAHEAWRARVNGALVDTLRADHALLGVPLDGDEAATVELSFEPAAVTTGLLVSLASLFALVAAGLVRAARGGVRVRLWPKRPPGRRLHDDEPSVRQRELQHSLSFYRGAGRRPPPDEV